MTRLAVALDKPLDCMNCDDTTIGKGRLPAGWVAETWPTESGHEIRIVLCFRCRRLTTPYDGEVRPGASRPPDVKWVDVDAIAVERFNSLIPALYTVKGRNW